MMWKTSIKNVLVSAGAYCVSMWLAPLVIITFAPITNRLTYDGDFEYAVVMPVVLGVPMALVAAGTGGVTAWLVDSRYLARWAILPALLFATFGFVGHHWVKPPQAIDRVAQVLQALIPAVACVIGATIVETRLRGSTKRGHAV